MVNLGGILLDAGVGPGRTMTSMSDGETHGASWHVHWYTYPLMAMLGLFETFSCPEAGSMDIAYLSELDPLWLDDALAFILNPEAALAANPIAQAACAADCAAATTSRARDELFWCAGCQGSMYPLSGNIQAHVGDIQSSLLAAQRLNYKLHRQLVALDTSGPEALCGAVPTARMEKTSWRSQLTNPVAATDIARGCNPTGRSTTLYEAGMAYPVDGEDFGYLMWRKRNCCVF